MAQAGECTGPYIKRPSQPASTVLTPTIPLWRQIYYGVTKIDINVLPWPQGMIFPTIQGEATAKTFLPQQDCGLWSGLAVRPSLDGYNVEIGGQHFNLSDDSNTTPVTFSSAGASPTPSPTPSPIPIPSASITTGPTFSPPITQGSSTIAAPEQSTSAISPSATNSSSSQRLGVSNGAVAGTAIGCLIAGALIAGLLFWLCLAKRGKRRDRDSEGGALALTTYNKKPTTRVVSLESGSLITPLPESDLPQPVEDKIISGNVSKICNSIKNHVQSYYYTRQVSPGLADDDDIQALGHDMPISVGMLSTLLRDPTTREIALRFCIAWVIISRLQGHTEQANGLLPTELTQCLQGIDSTEHRSKSHVLLTTRWRAITAELLKSAYVRNPFTSSDSRNVSIRAAVTILDSVLRPYADSRMDNQERKRNLEELIKRSAMFAFTLFSQPGSWDFDWKEEQGAKSGEICIFPALVQVTDENGELISPPRPFGEAVIRRLVA